VVRAGAGGRGCSRLSGAGACRAETAGRAGYAAAPLILSRTATALCGLLRDRAARRKGGRVNRPRGRGSTSAKPRAAPGRFRRSAPVPPLSSTWPSVPRRRAPPKPAPRRGGRRVRPQQGQLCWCCASPAFPSRKPRSSLREIAPAFRGRDRPGADILRCQNGSVRARLGWRVVEGELAACGRGVGKPF
jgi:hypothetical protein